MIALLHKYEWKADKLLCVDCGKSLHNEGAVVLLSNGKCCLIGSTCGPKRFPDEWKNLESEFDRLRKFADLRSRSDEICRRIPVDIKLLRSLRPIFRSYQSLQSSISRALGCDFSAFHSAIYKGDGQLSVERKASGEVREQVQTAERLTGRRGRSSASAYEAIVVGRIAHSRAITGKQPGPTIDRIIGDLDAVLREIAGDKISNAKMQKLHKRYNDTWSSVREVGEVCEDIYGFFSLHNFEIMQVWWSGNPALKMQLALNRDVLEVRAHRNGTPQRLLSPSRDLPTPSEVWQSLETIAPWTSENDGGK